MTLLVGDDLIDYAKTITSKQDFEYFLKCLVEDYKENKSEWENEDLLQYLDGLSSFVPCSASYYQNIGEDLDVEQISWRLVAEFLLAASVYGN